KDVPPHLTRGPAACHQMYARRGQTLRAALLFILDINARQSAIKRGQDFISHERVRDRLFQFQKDVVAACDPVGRSAKLLYVQTETTRDIRDSSYEMIDVHLLARDVRHLAALAYEGEKRRAIAKA